MTQVFTVSCSSCETEFPIDAAKVPDEGIRARCSVCRDVIFVLKPEEEQPESGEAARSVDADTARPEEAGHEASSSSPGEEPAAESPFGRRSPEEKAARLARVLVSDMVTYNPERHRNAKAAGTLESDFEEEIEKSWKEYVEQVGAELASSTSFFQEALNEILAGGEELF